MEKVQLGTLVKITSGFAFKSNLFNTDKKGLPLIRIRDVVRGYSDTYYDGEYKAEYLIQKGDALIGMDGEFNLALWNSGKALLNQRVCKIQSIDERLDQNYLIRFLPKALKDIEDRTPFVTVKHLSVKDINNIQIPLPPLAEQRRIASILDQADELRQKRQQAIEKLDQLLQATFIDMFGDPVSNPKGWDLYKLIDLGSISTGNTPSRDDADNFGNYLEWIKSDNLNNDEDYATTATEYLSEKGAKKGRVVPEGSILVTCIAGSFDCIGNLAMVERKVSFNQQINSITPNDTVILEFLYYLMKISKPIIQNASTNSMKGMISKSKFSEILLPIPSKEKQIQFVELFKKLYGLKVSHKLYLSNADSLFKSLQNQAFNGTL
ncbi:MAG: restriction endonuclease subunit S [Acinetobacter sp.]|uniref:restriction endonuclease subunit S n=1 Tax=Acinetobacter TaxID=469 RepID=UPI000450F5E9|nr:MULTISPECIES: restriction endonuclease subunit S [Acinetobacter]EXB77478.1 type I restriction modification DNA specificity domain protein [Acinetobacter sp. 1475718]MDU1251753.1 restriction endonuclease subunit S [Acinetobacter sp.]